jgi:hypothetical protein
MGWVTIFSFGLSLVAAAGISVAAARSKEDGRSFSVPVFVISAIVLYVILTPVFRELEAERQLAHYPFYKQIAKTDPATYNRIRNVVLDGVRTNRSGPETARQIAAILGQALPSRVSHASDEASITFATTMSQLLQKMSQTNPDACSYFSQADGSEAAAAPIDTRDEEQMMNAMAQLLESAVNRPQAAPDPEQGQALVLKMFVSLNKKYGSDTALLSGVAGSLEERKKVCEMSADLFREVTVMPKAEGSTALRYLLSKTTAERSAP